MILLQNVWNRGSKKAHWERVYAKREPTEVSWYQERPDTSLELLEATELGKEAELIDVGGGASTLVDHLLGAGYSGVTVLDISATAIERTRRRVGERAGDVTWLERDITAGLPEGGFDLWHDRAVFHFLVQDEDRRSYVSALKQALKPAGHVIVATFGPDGPKKCSGLPVARYSPEILSETLGYEFDLQETRAETHRTPSDAIQHFVYCRFRRT